jgi:hypothetical protein
MLITLVAGVELELRDPSRRNFRHPIAHLVTRRELSGIDHIGAASTGAGNRAFGRRRRRSGKRE